jgi:hypothetical protein
VPSVPFVLLPPRPTPAPSPAPTTTPEALKRRNAARSPHARLPRPRSSQYTEAERTARVEGVVELLGLSPCRYSKVGDATTRGISGGQVRVCVRTYVRSVSAACAVTSVRAPVRRVPAPSRRLMCPPPTPPNNHHS